MKFIYLIKCENDSKYKIGITKNVKSRLVQLQTGSFDKLSLINTYQIKNISLTNKIEKALHNTFSHLHENGEWFNLSLEDELNFVSLCEKIESNLEFLEKNRI